MKETEKRDKYTELARELKSIWKMKKIKMRPIIAGAVETILKTSKKEYKRLESWEYNE